MRFRLCGFRSFALLLPLSAALAGCGGGGIAIDEDGGGDGLVQKAEPSYCSSVTSYTGGVTVTGTATYQYRAVNPNLGLNGAPVSANIPHAEVVVVNSAGTVVQCSETDASGAISLTLPPGTGNYTLKVLSRSNGDKLKVSILEDYYSNEPYAIAAAIVVTAGQTNKSVGTMIARARKSESAKIEGGAFNILAQVYKANEYIRSTTGNAAFVAPKVSVYWRAGHNPYNYFGGTSPLSFYRPGYSQLFILGGNNGNVHNVDTDHFDNSIVLHEYAHFLEDIFARSESPGGSHNGNAIIDPRLAWSEGWANFFQAAVIRNDTPSWVYYIDTIGFSGDGVEAGTGSLGIKVDFSQAGGSATYDPVGTAGEGTFREMSVARVLFKTIRTVVQGGAAVPFSAVWNAFSGTDSGGNPVGMGSSQVSFRSIGHMNMFLSDIIDVSHPSTAQDWSDVLDDEKQNPDPRDYGAALTREPVNTCPTRTLIPAADSSSKSNQFRSNDFYRFDHTGGAKTLRLEYTGGTTSSGRYLDLDLHLYHADYIYQETGSPSTGGIVYSSSRAPALDGGVEQISIPAGLPAGRYLINVKAYTYQKTAAQLNHLSAPVLPAMAYRLKITEGSTTEDLCPAH